MTIGSFEIDDLTGNLIARYGDREPIVAGGEGTLICLTPTLRSWTGLTIDFPDPPKDWIYAWRGKQNYSFNPGVQDPGEPIEDYADSYAQSQAAQVYFTRTPQEYEFAQNLMPAPAGANFFAGLVRLSRTTAPTHTWWGRDLAPLQPVGSWIPWIGSGRMEAALGVERAMHLVIEDGYLKLIAEQSVGPAAGGAVHTWGSASIFVRDQDREGGSFRVNTTPGVIVWTSTLSPYRAAISRVIYSDTGPSSYTSLQYGNGGALPTVDPTNYQSTYSVDIKGFFGRRS